MEYTLKNCPDWRTIRQKEWREGFEEGLRKLLAKADSPFVIVQGGGYPQCPECVATCTATVVKFLLKEILGEPNV